MSPILCFFLPLLAFFQVITSRDTHTYPSLQQTEGLGTLPQSVSILLVKDLYEFWKAANKTPRASFWTGPPHVLFSYN